MSVKLQIGSFIVGLNLYYYRFDIDARELINLHLAFIKSTFQINWRKSKDGIWNDFYILLILPRVQLRYMPHPRIISDKIKDYYRWDLKRV